MTLWAKFKSSHATRNTPYGVYILILLVGLGFLTMLFSSIRLINTYITNKNHDLATVALVENQTTSDANLICFGLTLTFQQYSHLHTYEIFHLTPSDLATLLTEERPTYLLLDTNNIQQQWSDLAPGTNYAWLQQHAVLTPLEQNGTYTLFQINNLP